jgi:hypothetical protein
MHARNFAIRACRAPSRHTSATTLAGTRIVKRNVRKAFEQRLHAAIEDSVAVSQNGFWNRAQRGVEPSTHRLKDDGLQRAIAS